MARRRGKVGVAHDDVDLLERVLARKDLSPYEVGVFTNMLEQIRERAEEYGDDAYALTGPQRQWAERVDGRSRGRERLTGIEFDGVVRATIGRDLRLHKE
jgi:hypothetical protein